MTTNTGNANIEEVQQILDLAKQEAEKAEALANQEANLENDTGTVSKKKTEEEEKKEKEKEETIPIKTLKDLPTSESPYKRESKKSYKLEIKDIAYEFFGDGKVKITKKQESDTETETKKTKNIREDVQKALDEQAKEEKAKEAKATEQEKIEKAKKDDEEKEKEKNKDKDKEKTDAEKNENKQKKIEGKQEQQEQAKEAVAEIRTFQVKETNLRGCTDAKGNIIIEANYEMIELSSDRPPIVKFKDQNGKWGLMDEKGNPIIEAKYDVIDFPKEGNIACGMFDIDEKTGEKKGIKMGIVDQNTGKMIVPFVYKKIE